MLEKMSQLIKHVQMKLESVSSTKAISKFINFFLQYRAQNFVLPVVPSTEQEVF